MLAIAAEYNLECWQLDYNTAFLNADVVEEVYVKMAPGYEELDRKWSSTGNEASQESIRPSSKSNQLVEYNRQTLDGDRLQKPQIGPVRLHLYSEGRHLVILTLYVDDVLLLGKDLTMLTRIKEKADGAFFNDGYGGRVTRAWDGRYP